MSETPTPETDAEVARLFSGDFNRAEIIDALDAHARKLERELTAAQTENARLNSALHSENLGVFENECATTNEDFQKMNAELIAENARLTKEPDEAIIRVKEWRTGICWVKANEDLTRLRALLAEAVEKIVSKDKIIQHACEDWAHDDTELKKICERHGIETDGDRWGFKDRMEAVEELSQRLAEAQKDGARLDWLQSRSEFDKKDIHYRIVNLRWFYFARDLRASIDLAMSAPQLPAADAREDAAVIIARHFSEPEASDTAAVIAKAREAALMLQEGSTYWHGLLRHKMSTCAAQLNAALDRLDASK